MNLSLNLCSKKNALSSIFLPSSEKNKRKKRGLLNAMLKHYDVFQLMSPCLSKSLCGEKNIFKDHTYPINMPNHESPN